MSEAEIRIRLNLTPDHIVNIGASYVIVGVQNGHSWVRYTPDLIPIRASYSD